MEWLVQMLGREHGENIFFILSELFNNALDHGILKLDSALKRLPDGFERYLQVRAERLVVLSSGLIEIDIEPTRESGEETLKIRVKDSGCGFDHAKLAPGTNGIADRAGRGIALARNLCAKLDYLGEGNEVVAHYRLI